MSIHHPTNPADPAMLAPHPREECDRDRGRLWPVAPRGPSGVPSGVPSWVGASRRDCALIFAHAGQYPADQEWIDAVLDDAPLSVYPIAAGMMLRDREPVA